MIPIHNGRRVCYGKDQEQIIEDFEGYYLTIEEIIDLCIAYKMERAGDSYFKDKTWIEQTLKEL